LFRLLEDVLDLSLADVLPDEVFVLELVLVLPLSLALSFAFEREAPGGEAP
jgi:hypothetical protein